MKKICKPILWMTVILMLVGLLSGCSRSELTLLEAYIKSFSVKSMESSSEITLKIDTSKLSEAARAQAAGIVPFLNEAKLKYNQKSVTNAENTLSKAQIDVAFEAGGMAAAMGIWVDADFTKEEPSVKEIIKMPALLTLQMPEEYKGKEYWVLDLGQMPGMNAIGMDAMKKLVESSDNFNMKSIQFIRRYAGQFNPGFIVASQKPLLKAVNGNSYIVHQIKLDDAAFKSLIRYTANNALQNQDAVSFLKDCLLLYSNVLEMPGMGTTGNAAKEIEQMVEGYKDELPKLLEQVNRYMDTFEDVKVLGDQGIVLEYAVDEAGYIINQSGTIQLALDLDAIKKAVGKPEEEANEDSGEKIGVLGIELAFNTDIRNINKTVAIDFPVLNSSNSVNYADLMKSVLGGIPEQPDREVPVSVDGELLQLEAPARMVGNTVLVPVRQVGEALGAEVSWDGETESVTLTRGETQIVTKLYGADATVNGEVKNMEIPLIMIDDTAYISAAFIAENLGASVEWDEDSGIFSITTGTP